MKKFGICLISILLILGLFLTGCVALYGEQIHEETKEYSDEITFKFNLEESEKLHKINSVMHYSKTIPGILYVKFSAKLTSPNGDVQIKPFGISKGGSKKSSNIFAEETLFEIIPKKGEYLVSIKKVNDEIFDGKNLTIKVYKN